MGDGSCRRADPLKILELIGMLLSEIGRIYRDDSDRAHFLELIDELSAEGVLRKDAKVGRG